MLNSNSSTKISINAVSGTITKTYMKSWFECFHVKSNKAETVFWSDYSKVVLQVILCGDGFLIAEMITKPDFEEATQI